jgi:DNA-binding transcriptional LysR family regulator
MLLRGIDTNLIVALSALLQERNVTRAAKSLGLGQSSMSHALARLRVHFDDPLLVQVGRAMVLTERARALIEPVGLAVAQFERVFARQEKFDPATSERTFRIVATDNVEFYLLPKLMGLLTREAPAVDLRMHHLMPDWMDALRNGDVDLKLGRKYKLPSGFRAQDLFEERFVCVVRSGHPVGGRLTVAEYAELGHVVVAPTLGHRDTLSGSVDAALKRHGLRRRVVLTVPHFLVAPFVVAASDLVLTVAERLVSSLSRKLELRTVQLPVQLAAYKLTQVWAERSQTDPGHEWLRAAVSRAAGHRPRPVAHG